MPPLLQISNIASDLLMINTKAKSDSNTSLLILVRLILPLILSMLPSWKTYKTCSKLFSHIATLQGIISWHALVLLLLLFIIIIIIIINIITIIIISSSSMS